MFQKTLTGGRYNESNYPVQELWRKRGGGRIFEGGVLAGHYGSCVWPHTSLSSVGPKVQTYHVCVWVHTLCFIGCTPLTGKQHVMEDPNPPCTCTTHTQLQPATLKKQICYVSKLFGYHSCVTVFLTLIQRMQCL